LKKPCAQTGEKIQENMKQGRQKKKTNPFFTYKPPRRKKTKENLTWQNTTAEQGERVN